MSPPGSKRKRLRLVRVEVRPVLVIDDGQTLTDFENTPSVVTAADWPSFPARLKADIAAVERELNTAG